MITACRIVKAKHAETAFDGESARLLGGRWNSAGQSVVYAAESAALAALEMLVRLRRGDVLPAYVWIACSFERSLVSRLDPSRLPSKWRSSPAPRQLQAIGDAWLQRSTSAVLEVPSAIIPMELNYLLNPRHSDFTSIRVSDPKPFDFDLRLLRR